MNPGRSSRSSGGYPVTASSGKRTSSAPTSRAWPSRVTIRSRFPSRSPTTESIWASASLTVLAYQAKTGLWPRKIRSDTRGDLVEDLRVLDRGHVSGVLAERGRAHRAADDLRRPCLRKARHEDDSVGCERLAQLGRDEVAELFRVGWLHVRGRHAEDPDHLALDLVRDAD